MTIRSFLQRKSILLLTAAIMAPFMQPVYQANAADSPSKINPIRVALFIDAPKFSSLTPSVTLSSETGFDLGVRTPSAFKKWLSLPDVKTLRGSLDQYRVHLLATADLVQARTLAAQLFASQNAAHIFAGTRQGKPIYHVYYGSFTTLEQAAAAKDAVVKIAEVAALVKAGTATVAGPHYLNAGSFPTEEEANKRLAEITQAGLDADLALELDAAGNLVFSVWIGNESTIGQLNALKQQAAVLLPKLVLQQVNTETSYLIRKTEVTDSASGANGVPHYLNGASGQKTWIHPIQAGITVKERFGRTYRGGLELSAYNGKLAVINEVPVEEYLYSVVSSELSPLWPAEALKAQAVAARTYALKQGNKYQIANVSDTTLDQAYNGMDGEFDAAVKAVEATRGEALADKDGLIAPFFSSNAGGMTADPSEVWGNPIPYLKSVPSPDDGAAAGKSTWFRVALASGKVGYVRSDYLRSTGQTNPAGLSYYEVTEAGVNVRTAPYVDNTANTPIAQLAAKERVLLLDQSTESNAYSWIRGPYDASFLLNKLSISGTALQGALQSLEVTKRGPSGRVIEVKANGFAVKVSTPDALRSALGGLPSNRFEIEETGRYTIGGAGGVSRSSDDSSSIYALGAGSQVTEIKQPQLFVMGGSGQVRPVTKDKQYLFKGTGFGHGLGMSQWGAKGYAELGYDYRQILQTYYTGVAFIKTE